MSQTPKTIARQPDLDPAQDFYRLRREGIGYIAQMSSGLWTDYNVHDPGITILEALCYAITDLAYRTGWDIKDLLAPATPSTDANQPFPGQAFFTAREILTVNPATPNDFRRLLIDRAGVRNAWVFCKECACDTYYYAWCEDDQLKLSSGKSESGQPCEKIEPRGLYDVLVELEADPEEGDLNDHKVEYAAFITDADGEDHPVTLELRFPARFIENSDAWSSFLNNDPAGFSVVLKRLGATRMFDVYTDPSLKDDQDRDDYLRRHWRDVLYLDLEVKYSGKSFIIENIALRMFGDAAAKSATTADNFRTTLFEQTTGSAAVRHYRNKMKKAEGAIAGAKAALLRHRNLAEDYCCVKVVGIEEVAVCADVEVRPDADIEWVQARIWFEIERYFNPPVPFCTLQELTDTGVAVETIFNGPALDSGFVKEADLDAAALKSELRVSDILNRLMDIDGVIAINQLQLTKYDTEGNVVRGAADPAWNDAGKPIFDANKTSASWLMFLSAQHQPRLYLNGSRFLFYKNGLPFRARMDEALDTLTQLRGEAERPRSKNAALPDLPIPAGQYRNPEDYLPVQYSFPLIYGIGPEGLPSHVSEQRRAQAKQLKAYLMVFEQLLGNELSQLAHAADLFSLDTDVKRTYFVKEFTEELIKGFDEIANGLDKAAVEAIAETDTEFHARRNRFLDHLLARFGEQFNEYALLLTNLEGQRVALDRLIEDKIAFLNAYPLVSHDRAKAFDYSSPAPFDYAAPQPALQANQPVIKKRVKLLLGHPDFSFNWTVTDLGVELRLKFQLVDRGRAIWTGYLRLTDIIDHDLAKLLGQQSVLRRMSLAGNYKITQEAVADGPDKFVLRLKGSVSQAHGRYLQPFDTRAEAEAMRDILVAWSAGERMLVVEHLLLRPKFPGDALYPACSEGGCKTCGDADPYSFRLTYIMPGWAGPFESNMQMRDFADRTIRQETPAHLLGKICWVDQDAFEQFEDAWYQWLKANAEIDWTRERLQERVEAILAANLVSNGAKESDVCRCAAAILATCGGKFHDWMKLNLETGGAIADFPAFNSAPVSLCPTLKFNPGTSVAIENFLTQHYGAYAEVSFRLTTVVKLLAKLNNIYPAATLHDWDEGNDQNPVRLGKTALGN